MCTILQQAVRLMPQKLAQNRDLVCHVSRPTDRSKSQDKKVSHRGPLISEERNWNSVSGCLVYRHMRTAQAATAAAITGVDLIRL